MKLSIIIPAYNEANNLPAILEKVFSIAWAPNQIEVIVVNDGSSDNTWEILAGFKDTCIVINHEINLGKGAGVRTGLDHASGDYIVIQDADLEYDPEDLRLMLERAITDDLAVIYGSRRLGKAKKKNPKAGHFFYLGGVFLSALTNVLYGTKITDEATCYKMFKRTVLDSIKGLCSNGFEFCPEITSKIAREGIKIKEIPISYHPRSIEEGKKIKFHDGLIAIFTLLRFRFDKIGLDRLFRSSRSWIGLAAAFIAVRLSVLLAFWRTSRQRGSWQFMFDIAQPASQVLKALWHEACDWHPPLYYFFTTLILKLTNSLVAIGFIQCGLAFASVILAYKISRLFFNRRISWLAALCVAIEPYWAWHNMLLVSENIYVPLLLGTIYFALKFIKAQRWSDIISMSVLSALCLLTRLNFLAMIPLMLIFVLTAGQNIWPFAGWSQIKNRFKPVLVGLVVVLALISPWIVRNYRVYGLASLGNMAYTNIYFYNLPPLLAIIDQIDYSSARTIIVNQANQDLGPNVGDAGDCSLYTPAELRRQFAYYSNNSRVIILQYWPVYLKMHLFRATPFYFQPGYDDMANAGGGNWQKPDFSLSLLKGQGFNKFADFLAHPGWPGVYYLVGLFFWGICSFSWLAAIIYSWRLDRSKFGFFAFSAIFVLVNALLISPFVLARYRLPFQLFFFLPLIYFGWVVISNFDWRDKDKLKALIRKLPVVAGWAKKIYDWRLENETRLRVRKFLAQKELPFVTEAPKYYSIGHEPTIRCNLHCKMCYQGQTRSLRGEELPTEKVLAIYEKLRGRALGIKLVGGEPMVRPDIFELISFWDRAGIGVILQTNCTLINQGNINRLKELKKITDILTSLDGPQGTHDAIRGVPGTFKRLEEAVKLIKREIPQLPITVFATILINDNLDKFYELIDTAKALGLGTINVLFEQVYSSEEIARAKSQFQTWGWENGGGYRLNTQERDPIFNPGLDVRKIKRQLKKIRAYGIKKNCFVNFTPFNFYKNLDQYFGRAAGKRVFCLKLLQPELRINQQGDVVWCDVIEKPFGNLLEKSPDEIWLSPEYQNFRKFLAGRSLPICSRCCKAFYY